MTSPNFKKIEAKGLLGVVQFVNICPCAKAEQVPKLVKRKVAMLHAFTVGFWKGVVFYFSWLRPV